MPLTAIFANLSCSNLKRSTQWYASIFEREPDASPMDKLVEWHRDGAGFQLFEDTEMAGSGTMTLVVDDIDAEHSRLDELGLSPGKIEDANYTKISRLNDPDGNLVVLAQPH